MKFSEVLLLWGALLASLVAGYELRSLTQPRVVPAAVLANPGQNSREVVLASVPAVRSGDFKAYLGEEHDPLSACVEGMLSDMTADLRAGGFPVYLSMWTSPELGGADRATRFFITGMDQASANMLCEWVTLRWGWHQCVVKGDRRDNVGL